MVKIKIGTAGWDYKDWVGPFYPKTMERRKHLQYYSKYFDIVEINATFYNLPTIDTVQKWNSYVPKDFHFIIKVWKEITHKLFDSNVETTIIQFFERLSFLKDKVLAYLFQFPPWFKYSEKHFQKIKWLINEIPLTNRYILEFRDNSWFSPKILSELIDGERIVLGTSYMEGVSPYYFQNQRTYYIRLIGDRQLSVFNRVQRSLDDNIKDLEQSIKDLIKNPHIFEIFIIVNNHFSGFAPETANQIKKRWNLPLKQFNQQKKLTEFF